MIQIRGASALDAAYVPGLTYWARTLAHGRAPMQALLEKLGGGHRKIPPGGGGKRGQRFEIGGVGLPIS